MDVCLQAAECLKSDAMDENLQVSTATVKEAYTHVTTVNGKSKCALNRREETGRLQIQQVELSCLTDLLTTKWGFLLTCMCKKSSA